MLRRVGAMLSALLLLNVSAAEALRVCAGATKHVTGAATTGHEHHHQSAPTPTPTQTRSECCAAMSSCAVSIEIAGAAELSSAIPESDRVWAAVDGAPVGQVISPDPPPPKHQA